MQPLTLWYDHRRATCKLDTLTICTRGRQVTESSLGASHPSGPRPAPGRPKQPGISACAPSMAFSAQNGVVQRGGHAPNISLHPRSGSFCVNGLSERKAKAAPHAKYPAPSIYSISATLTGCQLPARLNPRRPLVDLHPSEVVSDPPRWEV